MMFGPPDSQSQHNETSMRWKIKLFSNDELRQKFVDQTVPQADAIGLTIPDPELRFDEATGHYAFGTPNWDEFFDVVRGNGPCNRDRMRARRAAHDEGAWVREAAAAHARKRAARAAAAAEDAA
jgi:ring-1,2-phenylacetyl-CoA epoxidase subunit PaaA